MENNYKNILKPIQTVIMFGTVAVIILIVLWVLGFGLPVTIAALLLFRHMYFSSGMLLNFLNVMKEHKTQYDAKTDDEKDEDNLIVDFGRKNYEFGEYKSSTENFEQAARMFVLVKRSQFVISEVIVWLCVGITLLIGSSQNPLPELRILILAAAGTLAVLWSLRLCFQSIETPEDLKDNEDNPETAAFRARVRRYGKLDDSVGKGKITLQGVRYVYPGAKNAAVDGISLEINPGERFGILGQTGSGKTTLLRLIGREADATEGAIYIDGADIRDYTSAALDKIFSEKVSLCEGTPPNERATTATIIFTSQSTKPVMFCDKIAVIENGSLRAVGTHEQLIHNDTLYRELYTADHPYDPLPVMAEDDFSKILSDAENE